MKPVKFNPFLEALRGSFGDVVFRRFGQQVYLSHKPDMSGIRPSPAQLAHRERFRQAMLYAHRALSDPLTAAPYRHAVRQPNQRASALALADFMHAPVIDAVDLSDYSGRPGDPIVVHAHDDFEVLLVQVSLSDASGAQLETAPAAEQPAGSGRWVYTAHCPLAPGTRVRATASASDRPGNRVEHSVEKTL